MRINWRVSIVKDEDNGSQCCSHFLAIPNLSGGGGGLYLLSGIISLLLENGVPIVVFTTLIISMLDSELPM